ncbi:hypothetical protein FG386_001452 [Cryptosporidium ryanae]|uniref:uncharacterized protein n=1 Tax=Cryptosporidium ryanae TaxID=515981 RepID=UPI00351A43E2|nr:hypothetical protein FG386_001452 [Cryptosporidium ryanae]
MYKEEPIELISQIKAIFYFIGGSYVTCNNDEEKYNISVINVSLPLIEERINNIQGVDHNLKLMISKIFPVSVNKLNRIN